MSAPTAVAVDVHVHPDDFRLALEADARAGLTAAQKFLPPVWFYDDRGSELFDQITRLPDYYLSRAELALLSAHADEIVRAAGADVLVELGSGTSEKTGLLLDAMDDAGVLAGFVPFDVSERTLRSAASRIATAYPGVEVRAIVGDFHRHLAHIPNQGRRMVAFLGSTIGNLMPAQRADFLDDLGATMAAGDSLLLGTDLVKRTERLVAAYDDPTGVTAAFNRNVLDVVNRELDGDFRPDAFDHVAHWNAEESWIEMRLRSTVDQRVQLGAIDLEVEFAAGEHLLTEVSSKFTPALVARELEAAGFSVERRWTSAGGEFLLTLARWGA
ncbi:MAG: L-histidine N(alpha)-methyltransferase [Acidimicrobiales bacterium]